MCPLQYRVVDILKCLLLIKSFIFYCKVQESCVIESAEMYEYLEHGLWVFLSMDVF